VTVFGGKTILGCSHETKWNFLELFGAEIGGKKLLGTFWTFGTFGTFGT
jgi:hypothetical protein